MAKRSFTHYYVQVLIEGSAPQPVYHTYDEEKDEYYFLFLDRNKAQALAEEEKRINPEHKFRVVKYTETYDPKPWF
jgi:hypothetical protein